MVINIIKGENWSEKDARSGHKFKANERKQWPEFTILHFQPLAVSKTAGVKNKRENNEKKIWTTDNSFFFEI